MFWCFYVLISYDEVTISRMARYGKEGSLLRVRGLIYAGIDLTVDPQNVFTNIYWYEVPGTWYAILLLSFKCSDGDFVVCALYVAVLPVLLHSTRHSPPGYQGRSGLPWTLLLSSIIALQYHNQHQSTPIMMMSMMLSVNDESSSTSTTSTPIV